MTSPKTTTLRQAVAAAMREIGTPATTTEIVARCQPGASKARVASEISAMKRAGLVKQAGGNLMDRTEPAKWALVTQERRRRASKGSKASRPERARVAPGHRYDPELAGLAMRAAGVSSLNALFVRVISDALSR